MESIEILSTADELVSDLALILIFGAISTILFKKIKQPLVLGYIVAGYLVGPHFLYVPSVTNEANIEFWAQLGIIVLLFSLGLEFSFKKLMNVGGSVVVTTVITIFGMASVGYFIGHAMGFSSINSMFLGAMISMSSTTIIIKALSDLNLKQRRFAPIVFGILICEDLFAVLMMVILSSIAINNSFAGTELITSILKLSFFLIIWFTVGIFIIPSIFHRYRDVINDEMLLILSMGLCFLMAIFSVSSGFSLALGAFVMGSILAGTCEAERIEHITKPIKDLFGAVFFISVGMLVDPVVIYENWKYILIFSAAIICFAPLFSGFGLLITGQPLKLAIETGFSLTQIGEFSFIIATLGMSLGVLEPNIYPIIVAVSVVTTFLTPYSIKAAEPFYNFVEKHLPQSLHFLIDRYSRQATQESESKQLWKAVAQRYIWRMLLYSVVIVAIMTTSYAYILPKAIEMWGNPGRFAATLLSILLVLPFLIALSYPSITRKQRDRLRAISNNHSDVPLVVMSVFRVLLGFGLIYGFLVKIYSLTVSLVVVLILFAIVLIILSKEAKLQIHRLENRFMSNLNERDLRKSGKGNNIIDDLHVAYITVGYECPFVGERLGNSNLRREYGVNVVSIRRGGHTIPIPQSQNRIFPGDLLGIIGTDEQIARLIPIIEQGGTAFDSHSANDIEMRFQPVEVIEGTLLDGASSASAQLRDKYSSLLVAVQRGEEYIKPTGDERFASGDILWLVGDNRKIEQLKRSEHNLGIKSN